MDGDSCSSIDWDTEDDLDLNDSDWESEDDLEIDATSFASHMYPSAHGQGASRNFAEPSCSNTPSTSLMSYFMEMGFPKDKVKKAIEENGVENADAILETLLAYEAIENLSSDEAEAPENGRPSYFSDNFLNGGIDENTYEEEEPRNSFSSRNKKKRIIDAPREGRSQKKIKKRATDREDNDELCHLPNPMIGFGVPGERLVLVPRSLPFAAKDPPYFYYENVALSPKGVWQKISSFLYDISPEYVDSKYFCAATRKRGYIHNLPIQNRFPILPIPPLTIAKALPETQKWWPIWDKRTQLNCVLTCRGSAKLTDRIRQRLVNSNGNPSKNDKKYIIPQCKKWNLVWVGKYRAAPLEPDEIEALMGYPIGHTRGCSGSQIDRYTALGKAFQVDTVAYHLSVLKGIYPNGINVLSLFSGIGGAEVALHRLGIPMMNVVSIEKSSVCRTILQSWWNETNQQGNLIHISDVKDVTVEKIVEWFNSFGGFDLVIGGSPCNNLAGGNRVSRDGLEGEHSSLFYDYFRILDLVRFRL